MLRGINLGGSSKVPAKPNGATFSRDGFFNHQAVSFVGRPFPLEDADEHFKRLKSWGFNFLRFLITWEAIEHGGPGIYDEQYLDYLSSVIKKAGEYDFNLFIDPHEDVWSRFTGGDGAPGWTLELVGFDLRNLHASGAAFLQNMHEGSYPRMLWPTNNSKLAASTMFTLFFGGRDFAPSFKIGGKSIQDYLQEHYFNSIRKVAERLKGMPNVIGYDTLNEPSQGWIGCKDPCTDAGYPTLYACPTVLQAMALGEGIPQDVDYWQLEFTGLKRKGKEKVNPAGIRAWRTGQDCIWRKEGIWDVDNMGKPVMIKNDHFSKPAGRLMDFAHDYLTPFVDGFTRTIRAVDPKAVIFIEDEPDRKPRTKYFTQLKPIVNAAHWYDVLVMLSKRYFDFLAIDLYTRKLVFGKKHIDRSFAHQLEEIKRTSQEMGDVPTLLGEFGIPFDMDAKRAYKTNDYHNQIRALDRSYRAIETNLMNSTLWNYTADNSNSHGDQWNDEDFSIFSPDQRIEAESMDSGGRALQAFLRPYPRFTAGMPKQLKFDYRSGEMFYEYLSDNHEGVTEIFIPRFQYPDGITVTLSDGSYEYESDNQRLLHHPLKVCKEHTISIKRK
jgi:hypothetical protein